MLEMASMLDCNFLPNTFLPHTVYQVRLQLTMPAIYFTSLGNQPFATGSLVVRNKYSVSFQNMLLQHKYCIDILYKVAFKAYSNKKSTMASYKATEDGAYDDSNVDNLLALGGNEFR